MSEFGVRHNYSRHVTRLHTVLSAGATASLFNFTWFGSVLQTGLDAGECIAHVRKAFLLGPNTLITHDPDNG